MPIKQAETRDGIFFADIETLNESVKTTPRRLLKLVVPSPRNGETPWKGGAWTPSSTGESPVLLLEEDFFELSFATSETRQGWHAHRGIYEIYISESPLHVEYKEGSETKKPGPVKGCLIIPPGVRHKVHLGGPTFVVQATADGVTRIANSKVTSPHI